MDFDSFHFLRPLWLIGFVPLVALAWYWVSRTQADTRWEAAVDDELLEVLLDGGHRRSNRWLLISMIFALGTATLGLAGPTWEKLPQNVEQKNDALIILFDLSLSMLAEDVKPSRVARARQEITDMLRTRSEGQTALIAYAGDAHAVVPLTEDIGTITNLLNSLSPGMMPVFGSNPDHAIQLAQELFENNFTLQGRIVMVTDGIDSINSVTKHRNRAYPISVLGIGTEAGGPIPLDEVRQPGRFLQTQEGNQVVALLDEQRLQEVAELSFGQYAKAAVGDADINLVLSSTLPGDDETIEVEREFDTWFDQGHWLALLLIPLLLASFRRGIVIALCCITFLPAAPSHASELSDVWDGLWQRSDQRGYDALRYGEPERAATLFENPQWRSVAEYRSGNYDAAKLGFNSNPSVTGRYNEGNALARLGDYEGAIKQYEQVLSVQPQHEDAAFNKALVEKLLEEKQASEQKQDQQNQANNDNSDNQQEQNQQQQDQSEQQEQGDSQEQQEQEQESESEQENQQSGDQQMAEAEQDETSRDEKQEALEQWLRRVPDDPGGLLRRKFSHETKQRLRRGEYENRQSEKIW